MGPVGYREVDTMVVRVNGEEKQVRVGATIGQLLEELGQDPRSVAVEHNGGIVSRSAYQGLVLAPGDILEVVRFVQGG